MSIKDAEKASMKMFIYNQYYDLVVLNDEKSEELLEKTILRLSPHVNVKSFYFYDKTKMYDDTIHDISLPNMALYDEFIDVNRFQ